MLYTRMRHTHTGTKGSYQTNPTAIVNKIVEISS